MQTEHMLPVAHPASIITPETPPDIAFPSTSQSCIPWYHTANRPPFESFASCIGPKPSRPPAYFLTAFSTLSSMTRT